MKHQIPSFRFWEYKIDCRNVLMNDRGETKIKRRYDVKFRGEDLKTGFEAKNKAERYIRNRINKGSL